MSLFWNFKNSPFSVGMLVMSDLCPPAGFGRKDVVDHLLRTGANVHARDDGGLIPLHNACSFGHSEVRLRSARVSAGASPHG